MQKRIYKLKAQSAYSIVVAAAVGSGCVASDIFRGVIQTDAIDAHASVSYLIEISL